MILLREILGEHIILRWIDFNCQLRSPDLTAKDFFLCGYKPQTNPELKNNIRNEIDATIPKMLRELMHHVLERARFCESENGRHQQDVISQVHLNNISQFYAVFLQYNSNGGFLIKNYTKRLNHNVNFAAPCI